MPKMTISKFVVISFIVPAPSDFCLLTITMRWRKLCRKLI